MLKTKLQAAGLCSDFNLCSISGSHDVAGPVLPREPLKNVLF